MNKFLLTILLALTICVNTVGEAHAQITVRGPLTDYQMMKFADVEEYLRDTLMLEWAYTAYEIRILGPAEEFPFKDARDFLKLPEGNIFDGLMGRTWTQMKSMQIRANISRSYVWAMVSADKYGRMRIYVMIF